MMGTYLGVLAVIGAFLLLLGTFFIPFYVVTDPDVRVRWKLLTILLSALIAAAVITALIESAAVITT